MSLFLVSILTAWAVGSTPGIGQRQQSTEQEQWVNAGVMVSPTTSLPQFVRTLDGAIVGTLERISMVILDEADLNTLHTVLTFRVNERLFGTVPGSTETQIDVLTRGGSFVEQNGKIIPKRPAEVTRNLAIGAEYFVPLQKGDKFGKELVGHLLIGSSIAMSRLDGRVVTPVMGHVTWANEVLLQAKTTSAVSGPAPTPREVFLNALRNAGRGK